MKTRSFLAFLIFLMFNKQDVFAQQGAFTYRTNPASFISLTKLSTTSTRLVFARGAAIGGTWISCYDEADTLIWSKQMGSSPVRFGAQSVTSGPNGTFYVSARDNTIPSGQICQMDSAGSVLWAKNTPYASSTDLVYLPASGNLIQGGGSRLWMYDSIGNFMLDREMPIVSSINDVVARDSTSALCVGRAYNVNGGLGDVYIMCVGDTGNIIWRRNYSGNYDESASSIYKCLDGNFLVTGWTSSYGQGNRDVFVLKINHDGMPLWARSYGTTGIEEGMDIVEMYNGNIVVSGYSTFGFSVERRLLMVLDSSGEVVRAKVYSDSPFPANSRMYRVVADSSEIYGAGMGTGNCFFQKSGESLNSGCNEASLMVVSEFCYFDLNDQRQPFFSSSPTTTTVIIPESPYIETFTVSCQSACAQDMNLNLNSLQLCVGDTLTGFIDIVSHDSIKIYDGAALVALNDSFSINGLSAGFHVINAIRYDQGCVDSIAAFVIVDTLPQVYTTASTAGLIVYLKSQTLGVPDPYWTMNGGFISSEDTVTHMLTEFGQYDFCLVAENACRTDTICRRVSVSDSLNYTYLHEMHTSSNAYNYGTSVAPMHDGGAVYCGIAKVSTTDLIYLNRLKKDGSSKWSKYYAQTVTGTVSLKSSCETADNGVLIVGSVTPNTQMSRGYIARFDSSGQYKWLVSWTLANAACKVNDIVQTKDSCYVAVGSHAGDMAIMKLNWYGQVIWFKKYAGYEYASAVVLCSDSGFAVTGRTFGGEMILMKISENGNWIWSSDFGGSGNDYGTDLVASDDGGFYILGVSTIFQFPNPGTYYDLMLVRTDSLGNLLWAKRYWQYGRNTYPGDIIQTENGNILMGVIGDAAPVPSNSTVVEVLTTDSLGNLIGSRNMHNQNYPLSVMDYDGYGEMGYGPCKQVYVTGENAFYDYSVYSQTGVDVFSGCNGGVGYVVDDVVVNYNSPLTPTAPVQTDIVYPQNTTHSLSSATGQSTETIVCVSSTCNPVFEVNHSTSTDTVSFVGSSSHNAQWLWYFGDGDSSSVQNPVHVYDSIGVFNVCVIISTSCVSDTICFTVPVLSTGLPEVETSEIVLYPNPTHNGFHFISGPLVSTTGVILEVISVDGRTLESFDQIYSGDYIEIEGLPNGVYFVQIYDDTRKLLATKKLVKN